MSRSLSARLGNLAFDQVFKYSLQFATTCGFGGFGAKMHRSILVLAFACAAVVLASCATPTAMTVGTNALGKTNPKFAHAMAVGSVNGGQAMNILTVPGVPNEPFKKALEGSLAAGGYAATGAPKYQIDADIKNLDQPLIGLEMEVAASVTYTVTGAGTSVTYPITAKGKATFSDSPIGADRVRIANERAMQENIALFLRGLK